jgi:hypothetical protein
MAAQCSTPRRAHRHGDRSSIASGCRGERRETGVRSSMFRCTSDAPQRSSQRPNGCCPPSPLDGRHEAGGRGDSEGGILKGGNPRFPPLARSGGGGNRTPVRGRTGQNVYERSPRFISPAGRFTDNPPTGQPSFSVALRAIGSPSAPSPNVGAESRISGRTRVDVARPSFY